MRYHIFHRKNGALFGSENCIYCRKNVIDLFNKLSENNQKTLQDLSNKVNYIKYGNLVEYYVSKYIICENGLSEEEYIIKELLE